MTDFTHNYSRKSFCEKESIISVFSLVKNDSNPPPPKKKKTPDIRSISFYDMDK